MQNIKNIMQIISLFQRMLTSESLLQTQLDTLSTIMSAFSLSSVRQAAVLECLHQELQYLS